MKSVFGSSPSLWGVDWHEIQPNFQPQKWPHKKGRWERRPVYGGRKSEILSNFFLCLEMIPKGFPHHLRHFSHPNSTEFTHFGPHFEACRGEFSCVLATPCSENLDFLEKKNLIPKGFPNHPKGFWFLPRIGSEKLFFLSFKILVHSKPWRPHRPCRPI